MMTDGRRLRIAISTYCKPKFKFFERAYIFNIFRIAMKSVVFTPESGDKICPSRGQKNTQEGKLYCKYGSRLIRIDDGRTATHTNKVL